MNQLTCQSGEKNDFKNYDYPTHQFIGKTRPNISSPAADSDWLMNRAFQDSIPAAAENCFFYETFRLFLRTAQPPVQWERPPPPSEQSGCGREFNDSPPSGVDVQMYGIIIFF